MCRILTTDYVPFSHMRTVNFLFQLPTVSRTLDMSPTTSVTIECRLCASMRPKGYDQLLWPFTASGGKPTLMLDASTTRTNLLNKKQ